MQTLSKGFKKPQTGDLGTVFFPAMEDNFQQLNDHTHDGSDSQLISAINLSTTSSRATVLGASFVDQGDGYWRASVPVPQGAYEDYCVVVRDPTTFEIIYLKQARVNASTFYLYTNTVQTFEVFFNI